MTIDTLKQFSIEKKKKKAYNHFGMVEKNHKQIHEKRKRFINYRQIARDITVGYVLMKKLIKDTTAILKKTS